MWKEHTTSSPKRGLWIGDYGLSLSMATESRYMTNCRQRTVLKVKVKVKVEEILLAWHARLER
jgi:hypothetical protein